MLPPIRRKMLGMTLVEMLVALAVVSIVMVGMTQLLITTWASQKYQIKLGQASQIASRGVSKVVKYIRQAQQADNGAYLFSSGDHFDIVFYGNIDGDTSVERVHYYLDNGTFYMGVTEPNSNPPYDYPVGDQVITTVSSNVVNDTTEYIFEYYDSAGNLLSTPASQRLVRAVSVTLYVDVDPYSSPIPVKVKSRTTMRNLTNN